MNTNKKMLTLMRKNEKNAEKRKKQSDMEM